MYTARCAVINDVRNRSSIHWDLPLRVHGLAREIGLPRFCRCVLNIHETHTSPVLTWQVQSAGAREGGLISACC